MVNQAKYDRDAAVEKATHLFWEKGFHATSMRNLQDHIDMRPGSIYAAFGSKEGLFKLSLQAYTDATLASLQACIQTTDSPLKALKQFVTAAVEGGRDAPSELCMLVKSVAELTDANADLLDAARCHLKRIEAAFQVLLQQAQAQGEISADIDPQRLARFLQVQLIGLRAYARTQADAASIAPLIDDAFSCLR